MTEELLNIKFQEMESSMMHSLLQVTPEEINSVRVDLNLNEDKIRKYVDAVEEWLKKEDHLVAALPYINRNIIERCLIISQGSLENCKRRIDKILTTRGLFSEIMLNKTFEEFEEISDNILCLMLPKPNPVDHTRIFIMGFINENFCDLNFLVFIRYALLIAEFRLNFEYIYSDRYILDLKNFKANMLTKINPIILKKAEIICTDTYGIRLKGVHIINAPPFVDQIMFVIKQVLKEKLARRIHVHKSYEELHQEISKEVLPMDYDGDAPSCRYLVDQWKNYYKTEEAKNVLDDSNKIFSNESRRSSFKFNEEYLGMPGSFKQLNVD